MVDWGMRSRVAPSPLVGEGKLKPGGWLALSRGLSLKTAPDCGCRPWVAPGCHHGSFKRALAFCGIPANWGGMGPGVCPRFPSFFPDCRALFLRACFWLWAGMMFNPQGNGSSKVQGLEHPKPGRSRLRGTGWGEPAYGAEQFFLLLLSPLFPGELLEESQMEASRLRQKAEALVQDSELVKDRQLLPPPSPTLTSFDHLPELTGPRARGCPLPFLVFPAPKMLNSRTPSCLKVHISFTYPWATGHLPVMFWMGLHTPEALADISYRSQQSTVPERWPRDLSQIKICILFSKYLMSSYYVPGQARQASTSGHSELAHESVALCSGPSFHFKAGKAEAHGEPGLAY